MSRTRNEFLDVSEEDDSAGAEAVVDEESRYSRVTVPLRKRRRLDSDSDSESAHPKESKVEEGRAAIPVHTETTRSQETEHSLNKAELGTKSIPRATSHSKLKPLSAAELAASQRRQRRTGVIYISKVPPFMKPSTIRHLLSPHGTILRLFLTPEPTPMHTRRIKAGGNKKKSFIDGWVEFASKSSAKICAETLNGNIIGGKKGGWYHDDLWNIKYLKGFKWDDLMEQVQSEARMREGRLRAEIEKESTERKAFIESVDRTKKERGMQAKKQRKKGEDQDGRSLTLRSPVEKIQVTPSEPVTIERGRIFRQSEVRQRNGTGTAQAPQELQRVLNKIF